MPVRNIERELEFLKALRTAETYEAPRQLKKALGAKLNMVVAKAAALIAEMQLSLLIPDLCAAFERLLVEPLKSDPNAGPKRPSQRP